MTIILTEPDHFTDDKYRVWQSMTSIIYHSSWLCSVCQCMTCIMCQWMTSIVIVQYSYCVSQNLTVSRCMTSIMCHSVWQCIACNSAWQVLNVIMYDKYYVSQCMTKGISHISWQCNVCHAAWQILCVTVHDKKILVIVHDSVLCVKLHDKLLYPDYCSAFFRALPPLTPVRSVSRDHLFLRW